MLRLTEQKLRSLIKRIILEAAAPNANTWGQNFIKNIKLEKPELLQNYRIIFNKEHIAFFLNYHSLYLSETALGNTENGEMNSFTVRIGKSIKNIFNGWLAANPNGDIPYYEDDDIGYELGEFMLEGLHGEAEIFQIEIRNINTGKNILTAYDYSDTEVDYGDEDEGDVGGVVSMSSAPTIYRPSDDDLLADENIDKFDKTILKNLAIIKVIRWYLSNEWQSYSAGQTPNDKASNYNIQHGSTSDADWVNKFGTAPSTTSPIPTPTPIPQPTTPKLSAAEKALKQKAKEAEIYSQWDQQNQSLNDKYFKKPTIPTKPKK
jgi:hypothetical protein